MVGPDVVRCSSRGGDDGGVDQADVLGAFRRDQFLKPHEPVVRVGVATFPVWGSGGVGEAPLAPGHLQGPVKTTVVQVDHLLSLVPAVCHPVAPLSSLSCS